MGKAVLLTGASGFVGRAILAELVSRGMSVTAVSRRPRSDSPALRWICADLLDPEGRSRVIAQAQAETMIHAAWDVEHGAFWEAPANADWCAASIDLASRFLAGGGRRIVGIGTCAEYALLPPSDSPWPESRAIAPQTAYGRAKAEVHSSLDRLCRAADAALIWTRLFHLYGPGEHPGRFVPSVLSALSGGQPPQVRAAELLRDFASTEHVARCILALMQHDARGAFNIGSGAPRSLGALARIIAEASGTGIAPALRHAPAPQDPAVMLPDLTRLVAATGLGPEAVDLSLGALSKAHFAQASDGSTPDATVSKGR